MTQVLFDRLKSNLAQCINDGTIYFVKDSNGNFTRIALGDGSKSHVVGIGPKMDDATKQELMSKLGLTISSDMGTILLGKLSNQNGVSSQKVVTYERTGLGSDTHEISTVGYVQQYMKTAKAMVYAGVFNAQTKEITDYNNAIISPSEEGNVTFDYLLNGNEGETFLTSGMSFIVGTAGDLQGYTGISIYGGETKVEMGDMIIIINVQQKEGDEGGSTYNEASILIIQNTNSKISDGAITTAKLADEAVTSSKLSTDIQSLIRNLSKTATFAGIATPTTNPGTPDGHLFYIANGKGIYTNFGGIDVTEDDVVVLYYDTIWHKEATGIASHGKLTDLESKIGVTISYTDAIPENGEYINRAFHLEEGKDVGLSANADNVSQEGTIIRFYIYKSDDSRDIAYVLNNQYYDSVRALFNNYAGEITGYAYYITTFHVGDIITSFTYYGLDKEVENAQREISNTANNLAYTQALAGGETHIYVDIKQGINLEPETKYSFPIKSGSKITFSADLYDVVSGTVYVYLWYSDGTESSGYRIGSKISIDKNVDYIGLYIPAESIIKDGSIMVAAIYENTTLNTAIEYADSIDKVYKLVGIGANSKIYNNWQVGDLYFSTITNKIYECVSINPLDTKPTELLQKGLLYLCDNVLYIFDGLSLTKYHDKDVINGVLIDYPEFLVGENISNDSTGVDKSTYIYKDLIQFDVDADEEIEISCDEIIDYVSSTPIRVYGYDADGHETEIKTLTSGIHVVAPSLSYNSIKVRLYPTTSGMSAEYCTFKNIRIRKYKRTDIPAYYIKDNYIQNKIDVIRQKMADANGNFDAFAFITDLHWPRNAKNSPEIINYLQDRVQLPRVFMGGDYADGINMDYIKAFNGFRGKIYRAIGNHEYMNYWEEDGIFSQKDITDANIWAIYQSGMTDIVIGDANTNYYYVDNVVQKMRYIILSVFTDGSAGKFEQAQATWLNDSLSNMPNGYTAIVIAHHYAYINYPDFTPILTPIGKQIADICDTHVGKVACMLQGHTHEDLMMKTDGGIPVFATTCDKSTADPDETSENEHYIYDKRINGTITEQAFDIVIINKTDKKVSLVRIGAPADKDGVDFYEVREQTYL